MEAILDRHFEVFLHSSIGAAFVEEGGGILRANAALCKIWGRTLEQVLSLLWPEITPEPDLSKDLHLLGQLRRGEIDCYSLVKRYMLLDGDMRWARLTVWRFEIDGNFICYAVTVEDLGRYSEIGELFEDLKIKIKRRSQ